MAVRPARIFAEYHIKILVWLSQCAIAKHSIIGDAAARIFQLICSRSEQTRAKARIDERSRWRRALRIGGRYAIFHSSKAIGPSWGREQGGERDRPRD